MKNSFVILICSVISISQLCCSQTRQLSQNIEGRYEFIDSSKLAGISLTLSKNGEYIYQSGTDLQVQHSYGKWTLKNDTLSLTSSINQKNIPVTINESHQDSIKENIVISLVQNLDHEIMDAVFMFNGDTSKLCIPLLQTGCDQKVGGIDSFRISFSNETYTPWIKLKDKRTNLIEVTAQVHDVLALYLFFTNELFLYKRNSLQYLIGSKSDIPYGASKGVILNKVNH